MSSDVTAGAAPAAPAPAQLVAAPRDEENGSTPVATSADVADVTPAPVDDDGPPTVEMSVVELGVDEGAPPGTTTGDDPPADAAPGESARATTGPGRRARARLARLGGGRAANPAVLEPLVRTVRENHPKADLRLVLQAYDVAELHHRTQTRRSGDPYITHPLAVTTILAELGMDVTTLVAGLLHDTVEDTPYTLDRVRADFGPDVAHLVDGCTKLDKVKYGQQAQAETIRKMIVAMARDPRVLVIKLADRLHNMRTLRFLPEEKQQKKATETLEIYAPLAHRLGMNTVKWELEDLAFATLYPKRYEEIVRLVAERAPSRDTYLAEVTGVVQAELRKAKIKASVTGRPKHYWSIYQKMVVRGREFADIYDLVGIRILTDSVRDCYAILGAIHAVWNPVPGRFKDYIAMPKFNMYQSLHTTVIGPQGKPVEMQIRTWAMHRTAEYGISAHWKYKERKDAEVAGPPGRPDAAGDMTWLRQLVEWQRETSDPGEFLDSLRFDLNGSEVYVFTPKGDVLALPSGATPVDFAYAVHTEVGHRCIGARVNGRLVPLESTLDNGDTVEVFTSKSETSGPSRDWLGFVASPRARNKIRQWFAKERREDAVEEGKHALARAVRKEGLPLQRLLGGDHLATLAKDLRLPDVDALYAALGEGHLSARSVVHKLVQALGGLDGATEELAEAETTTRRRRPPRSSNDPGVVVRGVSDVWVKLARCCHPVPGDDITGFVTRGSGVSVHRTDCPNVETSREEAPLRFVEVEWTPSSGSTFTVAVQVEALDRTRLLSDVTRVLSDSHVNILSASVQTTRDRVAVSRFTFEVASTKHLENMLRTIRQVDGVYEAKRVSSG